jgi:hypothetical protein
MLPRATAAALVLMAAPLAQSQPPPGRAVTREALQASGVPADAAGVLAAAVRDLVVHEVIQRPEGLPPVAVQVWLRPESARLFERVAGAATDALDLLTEWLGPYPHARLTVIEVPWSSALAGASYPGVIAVSTRWRAPVEEAAVERQVIAAVSRHYWLGLTPGAERWFEEGLVLFSSVKAIHTYFERHPRVRHAATVRAFGGFVPWVIRPVAITPGAADPRPRVLRFQELDEPAGAPWRAAPAGDGSDAERAHVALATLERYLGWPALQSALLAFRQDAAHGRRSLADLASLLSAQRGRDLTWFFDEAFRADRRFDYAVADLRSAAAADDPGAFDTTVHLVRHGNAVFAGTSQAPADGTGRARSLPVAVSFEDGTEIVDWWDGREPTAELAYRSRSRAVSAIVDPEVFLLLDDDRRNNMQAVAVPDARAVRPALHWLIWLQDLVLTVAAIL